MKAGYRAARFWVIVLGLLPISTLPASSPKPQDPEEAPELIPTDYLTFAAGAVPIAISGAGAALGVDFEDAVNAVDGSARKYSLNARPGDAATDIEFLYELPAETTFDRFAVPEIHETPSPSQTFIRQIEISGSSEGPSSGFATLGLASLRVHDSRGEVTEIPVTAAIPVRWVRLRLVGGIEEGARYFEFSEVIGNGRQEAVAMVDRFTGIWKARFGTIELQQEGPKISGCADNGAKTVAGTVTGNLARGTLLDTRSGTPGAFILSVTPDGSLRGVRSDNRAPFRVYEGAPAPAGATTPCSAKLESKLGCGSVLHGINFDFDSADIRPESESILAELFEGLQTETAATVLIVGHTSSEGSDGYNLRLSERRARAVVDDLVRRGIDSRRISASGRGESEPIASNDTETGRSLNRRVEVKCRE